MDCGVCGASGNQSSVDTKGQLEFGGSKVIREFLTVQVFGTPALTLFKGQMCMSIFTDVCESVLHTTERISICVFLFFRRFLLIYFLREGKGGRKREKHRDWLPLLRAPAGDQTCDPGICSGWESNWQPLVSRKDGRPSHRGQGGICVILINRFKPPKCFVLEDSDIGGNFLFSSSYSV